MRHGYWIPTNRACSPSLRSYSSEILSLQSSHGVEIPVLVADSGDEVIERQNAAAISELRAEHPELRITHLSWSMQTGLITKICESAGRTDLIPLFLPKGVNYGAAMNRIFLLSSAFGFEAIHRRDSDTTLQSRCPFPLQKELELLGAPSAGPGSEPIRIVGGGYIGEWNLDLKPFWEKDPKLFNLFLDCLWVPQSAQEEFISNTIDGCLRRFQGDYDLLTVAGEEKMPEAGNFALLGLHEDFPCLSAPYTLASDYFTFKIAHLLGCPGVFHERRVVHQYHSGRRSGAALAGYVKSLAKLCDHSPVYWRYLNINLKPLTEAVDSRGSAFSELRGGLDHRFLGEALREAANSILPERSKMLERMLAEFLPIVYPAEAGALLKSKAELIEECRQDYLNHASLLEAWPKLVQAARERGLECRRSIGI